LNTDILNPAVQHFINSNLNEDITSLILKGSPFTNIPIKEIIEQIESKKKCQKKLPTWFNTPHIYYPNKLNIAQTSSEKAANYKAKIIKGNHIIDITGGFGVDCLYFAKQFKKVTHCELNSLLSKKVQHNLQQFNIKNQICIAGDGLKYINNNTTQYDWIYVDPSRRNDLKGKVFLLKDCLPNIPVHLDSLLEKSENILIKNSPILDLKSCIDELKFVKKIHIIALKNEVKEFLVEINKNYIGKPLIKTINLDREDQTFEFIFQQDYKYKTGNISKYLYEPNSAILKSGGFNAISHFYKLDKLHQHSHLYTSENLLKFPGRRFSIIKTLGYHKKEILKYLPQKKANITTRNFKESVNTIRKKTGIKDGGDIYLFFTTDYLDKQIVIICKKII